MTEAKKKPDWERIEADYRAGVLSVREIGAAHGVSHTAINKRARMHGWVRDLSKRIQAKAEELVSKQTVSKEVSTETLETDRQIVESNAKVIADIRLTHRRDIAKARTRIAPLQDAVDLGVATEEEDAKLLAWKRYRVALNRIDQQSGYPSDVIWPERPDQAA